MNMIWSSFFNILPKPQYFLKLDIMFQWLKPYITWDRKKSHKWNKAFFILFLSLCVCLSCLRLCPPVLGFVVQDVQKGSPSRKNSLCLIAEGSVMIAAGFCPFEKLTEERHSMRLSPHLYVEVLQKGSQHVLPVHVCDCESAPEEKVSQRNTAVLRFVLNSPAALLFAGMLCLSTVAGYYHLRSFTRSQFYQSMTQTDRGGQGKREGRVTFGKGVALFCSFESDVNLHLRS